MTNAMKMDIEDFVRAHQDGLRRYLTFLGCPTEVSDDLAQEAFLVFLRQDLQFDNHGQASSYLRQTAFKLLSNSHRRESRRLSILRREAAESIWSRYQLDDRPNAYQDALHDCIEHLSLPMKDAVRLFYQRGMSGLEVAEAKNMSESDVWSTLHRARECLRSCINRKLKNET